MHLGGARCSILEPTWEREIEMPRERTAPTWLNPLAGLIGHDRAAPPTAVRRLRGERLEDRMVLSTAPVPVEAPQGQTLAEYMAQEHPMGPAIPADAPAPAAAPDMQQVAALLSPTSIDQLFGSGYGNGSGEGEGSGSGSGGISGSGSGGGAASGSGSGEGEGSGSGSGSGSGGSSGSGSSGGDPSITGTELNDSNGDLVVTGQISDNGGLGGLTITFTGGSGTFTIDENGRFTLNIIDTGGNDTFTITVTDQDGNSTSYTFTINI